METVLLIFHVLVAVALIALVLLQQGKGAEMGAAFGSGASSTVFGSQGSASFLSRATGVLAALFFATSLALVALSRSGTGTTSVIEQSQPAAEQPAQPEGVPSAPEGVPAVPGNGEGAGQGSGQTGVPTAPEAPGAPQ
jgi:preprotein translocase subunit SecG